MRDCLALRSVIWVLGEDIGQAYQWIAVLNAIFPGNQIVVANLPPPPRAPESKGLVGLILKKVAAGNQPRPRPVRLLRF
jgi:hypothetical protein